MYNTLTSLKIILLPVCLVSAMNGFTQDNFTQDKPTTSSDTPLQETDQQETDQQGAGQPAADLIPHIEERLGRYETAISGYLQLVERIEAEEGQYSPALIEPLLGLSRSYLALRELESAQDSAARAQHLQHRDEGVLSLDQLAVIELKTKIHLLEGKPQRADKQQRFAFYVAERNHGTDTLDVLPATYKLIDWYTATGQYHKAQRLLSSTIESLSEMESVQPALLPALLRSARLRRLRGIANQHKHLEGALSVITQNRDIPQARQNEVYLALADAYLVGNRFVDAEKYYQILWDNLPPETRVDQFSQPKELALSNLLNESTSIGRTEYQSNNINRLNARSREFRPFDRDNELNTSAPQKLVLPFQEEDYSVMFNPNSTDPTASKTLRVVGEPFRFVRDQLTDFLPTRFKSDEGLATINIKLAFSVNAEGRTHNVKATSDQATGRLLRTMRRILSKTRFRPRLIDGKPVATDNVVLIQKFPLPAA